MSFKISEVTLTTMETVTAFDIVTGEFKFVLDELQDVSITQTQDKADITGKQGRKLSSLKKNKAATISGTNGMISSGLLEMQTGSQFETKDTFVLCPDYMTITSDEATTTYKATGTAGNEIDSLYIKNADGTLGTKLTQNATAADGKFAYNPTTKTITFNTDDFDDGTEIIAYYKRKINADVLKNDSGVYSEKCALYIDAFGEDKCANTYHVQLYFPKADFNGEFSLELGGDQSVHKFEAEALSGACGTSGELWTYTVFGANAEDVD